MAWEEVCNKIWKKSITGISGREYPIAKEKAM